MRAVKYNNLMDLAGQGASASPAPGRSQSDDRGYILAVLLIGMAVAAVWMTVALPAWRQQVQRQRELDLIFRGEQYARAVALYVMKNNCALPTNVDDLVAQHYLRKKWNDPITSDDFVLLPGVQPGVAGGQQPIGGVPSRAGAPGSAPAGQPSRSGAAPGSVGGAPSGGVGSPGASSGTQSMVGGGIGGVMSKSTDDSIIVYNGQQNYSGWQFLYQNQLQKMGQSPQCGQAQGGPGGRGNQQRPGAGNGPGGPGGAGGTRGRGDGRGGPGDGRGGPGDGRGGPGRGPGGDTGGTAPTTGRIGRGGGL